MTAITLLVKDSNSTTQPIATGTDVSGNLVPVHLPALLVGNIATPVQATAPLPVINTAGAAAVDGSGTITLGNTAQTLFAGAVPVNGFLVCNNSSALLYVSDAGTASAGGSSIQIAVGATFVTPPGYKPAGVVSIFGGTSSQAFAARRW